MTVGLTFEDFVQRHSKSHGSEVYKGREALILPPIYFAPASLAVSLRTKFAESWLANKFAMQYD